MNPQTELQSGADACKQVLLFLYSAVLGCPPYFAMRQVRVQAQLLLPSGFPCPSSQLHSVQQQSWGGNVQVVEYA
jgi:hypothetical protein